MQRFKYEEARKVYQEIQEKAPDRSYDADIMLRIADTYFGEEKYAEAQVEYQAFLNFHPVHRDASYASTRSACAATKRSRPLTAIPPSPRRTERVPGPAGKVPGSPYEEEAKNLIADCREKLAEYELYVGRFYYRKGAYKSALGRLEKLLGDFPGAAAEKDALYYVGLSFQERGDKAKAITTFETLAAKYPAMAKEANAQIEKLKGK